MLDFDAALDLVLEGATLLAHERLPLRAASGRILAAAVVASRPVPEFDYSAMDGYALRTADLSASKLRLPVVGTSSAGSAPEQLAAGTTMRIFTGAPLPAGADAVAMQENVERVGEFVEFREPPNVGDHVRRRGEDLQEGAQAIARGVSLNAFHLSLAASLDCAELVVAKRPAVSILCTGDELRAPGSPARPGSVPESNGIALCSLVESAGGIAHLCPFTSDDPHATRSTLENALSLGDVVVTVGGVSVGDRDIVRQSLESLGVSTVFHKVAIKPGKPLYFGKLGGKRVLGLPGNPASALVTFALFGMPLLRALQGSANPLPARTKAQLTDPIKQRTGRRVFQRGCLDQNHVTPLGNQASGATTGMAWANALIVVPESLSRCEAGQWLEVIPFREF